MTSLIEISLLLLLCATQIFCALSAEGFSKHTYHVGISMSFCCIKLLKIQKIQPRAKKAAPKLSQAIYLLLMGSEDEPSPYNTAREWDDDFIFTSSRQRRCQPATATATTLLMRAPPSHHNRPQSTNATHSNTSNGGPISYLKALHSYYAYYQDIVNYFTTIFYLVIVYV